MYNGHNTMISTPQLQRQVAQLEETQAQRLAARALGMQADCGIPAIEAEMLERAHEALHQMDLSEDTIEQYGLVFPDDYTEWMRETEQLRNGG